MTDGLANIRLRYRPIVNPLDDKVRIYRAVPVLVDADGAPDVIGAKKVLAHRGKPLDTAQRNARVIELIGYDMLAAHAAGHSVLVMIPINAEAMLTKEAATVVVEALETLTPEDARAVVSQVFDLPERLTMDILDDAVIPLMFKADKFIIEPPLGLEDYMDIGACNAQGVAVDLGVPESGAQADSDVLTKVWSRAAPRRLAIFVQDVDDAGVLDLAKRYECRGVDGPLYGPLLDAIGPRTTGAALLG